MLYSYYEFKEKDTKKAAGRAVTAGVDETGFLLCQADPFHSPFPLVFAAGAAPLPLYEKRASDSGLDSRPLQSVKLQS